ncbi:MAG: biotin--[acetyl-CoA-carboxylase] ligase, partial [Thermoplasmata archaeon]
MVPSPKKLEFAVKHFKTLESTMDTAKEMAEEGAAEGTVIIADQQTCGRGRNSRTWESPQGGLYLSLILRPNVQASEAHKLIILSGVAAARALEELTKKRMETKWPNDLIHSGRKIGGLLCETSSLGEEIKFAVLGIGINTNISHFPSEIESTATSLLKITGNEVGNDLVADGTLKEISARYEGFPHNFPELLEEWRRLSNTLGRDVLLDGE